MQREVTPLDIKNSNRLHQFLIDPLNRLSATLLSLDIWILCQILIDNSYQWLIAKAMQCSHFKES